MKWVPPYDVKLYLEFITLCHILPNVSLPGSEMKTEGIYKNAKPTHPCGSRKTTFSPCFAHL